MHEGTLFYFAVAEWVPPLSFPALTHNHARGAWTQREKFSEGYSVHSVEV